MENFGANGKMKGAFMPIALAVVLLLSAVTLTYFGVKYLDTAEQKEKLEMSIIYDQYQTGIDQGTTGIVTTGGCVGKKVPIESITFNTMTKYANSYSADSSGAVKAFGEFANPLDANANPVRSNSLSSGTVTDTGAILKTNTNYRWIYDGAGTYYGVDLDVFDIDYCDAYSEERGVATFPVDPIVITEIGTISDMGDETDWNQTDDAVYCNGQTSATTGTDELGGASDSLTYDISVGDGVFSECVTVECTGANKACWDMVLEPRWDTTNPPEGNEITSITVQLQEGTDFNLPSEVVNYWKNQIPISINNGDPVKGGQKAVYKFTYTVTEANLDANDDWTMFIDDQGGLNALDIGQDVGATSDKRIHDSTT